MNSKFEINQYNFYSVFERTYTMAMVLFVVEIIMPLVCKVFAIDIDGWSAGMYGMSLGMTFLLLVTSPPINPDRTPDNFVWSVHKFEYTVDVRIRQFMLAVNTAMLYAAISTLPNLPL